MTLVLAVLRDGPCHGYELAKEVERRSNVLVQVNDGTLYPVLHALEAEQLIVSAWSEDHGDRPRRVYSLTEAGLADLHRRVAEWKEYRNAIEGVLLDPQ
jgi:DNA-binding PadR family transcriptional regulator